MSNKALDVQTPATEADIQKPPSAVVAGAEAVSGAVRIVRFRNRAMLLEQWPYPHFVPLTRETFDGIAYPLLGGVTRSRMADIFAYLANTTEDLSGHDRYILFGLEEAGDDEFYHKDARSRVWDMDALEWVDVEPHMAVWRSPYGVIERPLTPHPFIMSLAGGDAGLYDDIMQSLAPIVMTHKPDGVIWWVGDGANGKSTLMDAIYRIFPGQLSSITVKALADGRDTPRLNGTLANIVKESSEGRVEDTETYKAVGTHEDFTVHKFHSQDSITIRGNLHHIFSANNIPVFNDKGHSARRRTFIVPFTQRFASDPLFESRTFTPDMFGHLIYELTRYAVKLRDQRLRYKFSEVTDIAKGDYDAEANNAEEYAKHIKREGVVAFESFHPVRSDYENWCADMGYVPLGIGNMRRALQVAGFDRVTYRAGDGKTGKHYRLVTVDGSDLQLLSMGRPGLFTTTGFQPAPEETPIPPEFEQPEDEPEPQKKPILNNKW
jgi:hypothetical protein